MGELETLLNEKNNKLLELSDCIVTLSTIIHEQHDQIVYLLGVHEALDMPPRIH